MKTSKEQQQTDAASLDVSAGLSTQNLFRKPSTKSHVFLQQLAIISIFLLHPGNRLV